MSSKQDPEFQAKFPAQKYPVSISLGVSHEQETGAMQKTQLQQRESSALFRLLLLQLSVLLTSGQEQKPTTILLPGQLPRSEERSRQVPRPTPHRRAASPGRQQSPRRGLGSRRPPLPGQAAPPHRGGPGAGSAGPIPGRRRCCRAGGGGAGMGTAGARLLTISCLRS